MDRAQSLDGEIGVVCLVMFTAIVMNIKMSKMVRLCIFC